jgi:hypothetical protein
MTADVAYTPTCSSCGARYEGSTRSHRCSSTAGSLHVGDRVQRGDHGGTVVEIQRGPSGMDAQVKWDGAVKAAWWSVAHLERAS